MAAMANNCILKCCVTKVIVDDMAEDSPNFSRRRRVPYNAVAYGGYVCSFQLLRIRSLSAYDVFLRLDYIPMHAASNYWHVIAESA